MYKVRQLIQAKHKLLTNKYLYNGLQTDPVGKDEIPWLPGDDPTPEAEEIVEE